MGRQQGVDIENISLVLVKSDHQYGISGDPRIQRRHSIQRQSPLRLLQIHPSRIADAENVVALLGVLLLRQELIAEPLRQVRLQEHLLLRLSIFADHLVHKRRKGLWLCQ